MKHSIRSLRFALEGLAHALRTERNLKLFGAVYALSLLLSVVYRLTRVDLEIVIFTGGVFLAIELMNTALERFSDAFDTHSKSQNDHHTRAIKATKDVAAGASLVCALAWGVVLMMVFAPYVR